MLAATGFCAALRSRVWVSQKTVVDGPAHAISHCEIRTRFSYCEVFLLEVQGAGNYNHKALRAIISQLSYKIRMQARIATSPFAFCNYLFPGTSQRGETQSTVESQQSGKQRSEAKSTCLLSPAMSTAGLHEQAPLMLAHGVQLCKPQHDEKESKRRTGCSAADLSGTLVESCRVAKQQIHPHCV